VTPREEGRGPQIQQSLREGEKDNLPEVQRNAGYKRKNPDSSGEKKKGKMKKKQKKETKGGKKEQHPVQAILLC